MSVLYEAQEIARKTWFLGFYLRNKEMKFIIFFFIHKAGFLSHISTYRAGFHGTELPIKGLSCKPEFNGKKGFMGKRELSNATTPSLLSVLHLNFQIACLGICNVP